MQLSMSPPWYRPKPSTPAATQARSGAPVVAVFRAASVDGGVMPWSMNDTRIASIKLPIDGDGTSPISSR
jgi:hypothetical protein